MTKLCQKPEHRTTDALGCHTCYQEAQKELDAAKLQNRELRAEIERWKGAYSDEISKVKESNRFNLRLQNVVDAVVKRHKIWLAEKKGDIWQADAAAKVAISNYIGESESVAVRNESQKR